MILRPKMTVQNKFIQIIGLQRSGTNYIEELLKKNINNITRIVGEQINDDLNLDKHRIEPYTSNDPYFDNIDLIFFVYKNLFSWIESIAFRWSGYYEHRHKTYYAFESADPDLLLGPQKFNIINLAKTYDLHMRNWVIAQYPWTGKIIFSKYENLLVYDDVKNWFNKIENYGLIQNKEIVIPQLGKVKHSELNYDNQHIHNYKNYKTIYLTDYQKTCAWAQLSTEVKNFLYENKHG